MQHPQQKTWIEINKRALASNVKTIRELLTPNAKLWAVVKSNAYGHGLVAFSKTAAALGVDGFCVDSVIEGLKLRREGITKPILVLGPTLPETTKQAAAPDITISISHLEALKELVKKNPNPTNRPAFHIKIDTGMHRQGFYLSELPAAITFIKKHNLQLTGIFSHFASAKDPGYPTFANRQFEVFEEAVALFNAAGFTNLIRHIAATGGTLLDPRYHLDAVRIGIGLYGIYPSKEMEVQLSHKVKLQPILSWRSIVSEVKIIKKGEYVGYDLTERMARSTRLAIVPVGYWHGLPWSLSGTGSVLIDGKHCKIIGRISMDMIAVDVTETRAQMGDIVTLIGSSKKESITAREIVGRTDTTPYEMITRLNPLIERIVI